MKKFSTFIRFNLLIVIVIIFPYTIFSQQNSNVNTARKIIYISNKVPEITRPRISVIKNESDKSGNIIKKLKPTDHSLEKRVFRLINEKRIENGLKKLAWNDDMANLARQHSQNMAAYSFFSHQGLNGRMIDQRALDFGINKWQAIGENIAYNKGFEKPGDFAVERWMLSEGHRMNLLDERWKESGIGVGETEDGIFYFTQVFLLK